MSKLPLLSVGKLAVLPTQEIKKQILESTKTPEHKSSVFFDEGIT
jgi:hypothetical protein